MPAAKLPTTRRDYGRKGHTVASVPCRIFALLCHALPFRLRQRSALRPTAGRQPLTRSARVGPKCRDAEAGLNDRIRDAMLFGVCCPTFGNQTARGHFDTPKRNCKAISHCCSWPIGSPLRPLRFRDRLKQASVQRRTRFDWAGGVMTWANPAGHRKGEAWRLQEN